MLNNPKLSEPDSLASVLHVTRFRLFARKVSVMLRLILLTSLVSSLVSGATHCSADEPAEPCTRHVASDPTDQSAIAIVVANQRLLDLIVTWIDSPAECLFDRDSLLDDGAEEPASPVLPIARMLEAKCFIYCPGDESPIEAIYRERLMNHGVKVIPIALPSSRPSRKQIQKSQKQSLLAGLQ
jgi:hypothetical protein